MKILHIEDNKEFRDHVAKVLLLDHEVTQAEDGCVGIQLFDENHFDVILLDYQMIDVHGPVVIRHIRQKNTEIPVVAMSMDDSLNQKLLALGATIAVPKRDVHKLPETLAYLAQ